MSDLDFSQPLPPKPTAAPAPPPPPVYNVAMAMEFFKSAGKAESFAAGATIFAEGDKKGLFGRDKMYILLLGEIEMVVGGKVIGTLKFGEVFGEMAVIAQAPRTATARAKTQSSVISLDDKQFEAALQQKPEFALQMMSVMNQRVRNNIARLRAAGALQSGVATEAGVFEKKLLQGLVRLMGDQEPIRYEAGKVIMQEGSAGALMYVVLEGRVGIAIKGSLVGRVGAGGMFGEMALVDQGTRAATATAEADCTLLAINRPTFLQLVKTSPAFGASLLAGLAQRAASLGKQ
jgi:CRP/FNR family cyclic AMP-dependent transcriptional regulator